MSVAFEHVPHPRVAARKKQGPPKIADEHVGPNGRIALLLTTVVRTMWCAYAFAVLALIALPSALGGVMLSVIMVGQDILGRAADKRADMTYRDAEAILQEAEQIQAHLKAQDEALNALLERVETKLAGA